MFWALSFQTIIVSSRTGQDGKERKKLGHQKNKPEVVPSLLSAPILLPISPPQSL